MGAWNEAEARQRFEETMRRKVEAQRAREAEEARRTGAAVNGSMNGIAGGGGAGAGAPRGATTFFDAVVEEERMQKRKDGKSLDAGFSEMSLSSNTVADPEAYLDPNAALGVLSRVRSIRGGARQEYGKVYAALGPYYFDIAQSRNHTDPILFKVFRDPEGQAAMLAQIKTFAKSDFAQGWDERQEKLTTMTAIFESAVLREFEQGYEAKDYDGRMRRYAKVLVSLNGGGPGIDTYIHNHPILLHKETFGNPLDCLRSGSQISLQPSLEFFQRLATSINEERSIIDRVFPPSVDVLLPFLQRVGEEVINEYTTTLFDEAHSTNLESYLKAVSGVFQQGLRFANSIQAAKGSKPDFLQELNKVVATCFEPHVDLYLQEELDYFKTKADLEVTAWEKRWTDEEASTESFFMSKVDRQVAKKDFLTSFKKVVMMPVNVLPTIPLSSPFGGTQKPISSNRDSLQVEGTPSRSGTPAPIDRAPSPRNEAPTSELAAKAAIMNSRLEGIKTLFSIEVALNLVHTAKASLERAALFAKLGGQFGEEAKDQCEAIFVQLLQILGVRHIKIGFDRAVAHLSTYKPREVAEHGEKGVEPLVTFLELVNVGDLIQQMIDVFFVQELTGPKLVERDDFLSPAVKEKKRFEQMLDESVAAGLNKGIDVLMDEVEYVTGTTQKPTDFNPVVGPNGFPDVFDIGPSQTATRTVELVSSHTSMLVGSTDKNMLDVFNQEVGLRLFGTLCKHLKRQRISVDGAIKLIRYVIDTKSLVPMSGALRQV